MLQDIRRKILETFRPISLFLSKIGFRFGHGHISYAQVQEVLKHVKPGSIILTRIKGELSNFMIPGFYTHAALVLDSNVVIEALYPKVKLTNMYDFMMSKNHIVVVEPQFANEAEMFRASQKGYELLDSDYDLNFEPNNKAFYCSEVVWFAYSEVIKDMPFQPRERMGVLTVTPQDLYNAKTKFKEIYKCDSN